MNLASKFFQDSFQRVPARCVLAPGRIELLGNHTDYNEGLVIALAVDRHILMAGAPRNDGKIELVSAAFAGREIFYADKIEKNPAAPWADYVKGVLLHLRLRGVHFTGFNAAIHGTLPPGAGMSSSAALEVATALLVRKLFPYALSETGLLAAPRRDARGELPDVGKAEKLALARICLTAERSFVGANVGMLDYLSSFFGKAGHVVQIDCQHFTVTHEPLSAKASFVVCNSGVRHDLTDGAYNTLRNHCESAAGTLGVPSLRSVTPQMLELRKSQLGVRDYECARHVIEENKRVIAGERALRADDMEQLGQLLYESHASSQFNLKNSCPELDLLVDLARARPECMGARLTGGGFGGATINLVRSEGVKLFIDAMKRGYNAATGQTMEPMVCRAVDGAR